MHRWLPQQALRLRIRQVVKRFENEVRRLAGTKLGAVQQIVQPLVGQQLAGGLGIALPLLGKTALAAARGHQGHAVAYDVQAHQCPAPSENSTSWGCSASIIVLITSSRLLRS